MSSSLSPSWLKETPLHFEDITRHHASPVAIYLPTINDDGDREVLPTQDYQLSPTENDKTLAAEYRWKYLSEETGLHHREDGQYPGALLWRIVSGGTLTIHCVDSSRNPTTPRNQPLTALQFQCPARILRNCVGFTESSLGTILFILTEDCVLHMIPLSQQILSGEERRPEMLSESIATHRPLFLQAKFGQGKLSLDLPHFMHVDNAERLIFAMRDGSIHQYNPYGTAPYKPGFNVDYAVLRFHGDATLRKALKGWIPTWSGHSSSYPAHIVLSSVTSSKHSLLFTISADQRLRIWSLDRSQFIKEYDITSSPATSGRLLPQAPGRLVAIDDTHEHGEYLFYLLTYNSLGEGQFIIWGGQHSHGAFTGLVQLQAPFKPDIPSGRSDIWIISNFFLTEVKTFSDSRGTLIHNTFERALRLWISWKSYYSSVTQYTDLAPELNWVTIMSDTSTTAEPNEVENSVDFWTDRILKPGRFTDSVLIAALNIYQNHVLPRELHRDLSSAHRLLRKDLLSAIVGCKTKLGVNPHSNHLDFEKYRIDLGLEFSQFETTCKELSKAGDELRGISHNPRTGEVTILRADGIATIRNLSAAEILLYGITGSDGQFEDVVQGKMIHGTLYSDFKDDEMRAQIAAVARASHRFRCAIAGGNLGDITAGLLEEVMSDSHFSVEDRLWNFYDKYLPDDSFVSTELLEDVSSSLVGVKDMSVAFKALLDILSTDICQDDTISALEKLSSIWGDAITVGIGETVSARWTILRDFALLAAWLYSTEQQSIDPSLKSSIELFWTEGLCAFKGLTLLRHLSSTEILHSPSRQSEEDQVSGSLETMKLDETSNITHLPLRSTGLRYLVEETLDLSGVGLSRSSFPTPAALSLAIASSLTNINFADGYSGMAIRIVSQLLRLGADVDAARFARYLPNTPVGGYVWGHVLLQKGSWDKSAAWFSRVASALAKSGRADDYEYAKVILRGQRADGVGKGVFRYYEHVANLFDSKHAHSQAIYFSQMALGLAEVSLQVILVNFRDRRKRKIH